MAFRRLATRSSKPLSCMGGSGLGCVMPTLRGFLVGSAATGSATGSATGFIVSLVVVVALDFALGLGATTSGGDGSLGSSGGGDGGFGH